MREGVEDGNVKKKERRPDTHTSGKPLQKEEKILFMKKDAGEPSFGKKREKPTGSPGKPSRQEALRDGSPNLTAAGDSVGYAAKRPPQNL